MGHSNRRLDPEYRAAEQERDTMERSVRRQNAIIREEERQRDAALRRSRREDPIRRRREQILNSSQRRVTRQQTRQQQANEQESTLERVQLHRSNPANRQLESERQTRRNIRRRRELSPDAQLEEQERQRRAANIFDMYALLIKKGPTEICVCCGGTWFPYQVKKLEKCQTSTKFARSEDARKVFYLSSKLPSSNQKYNFCDTCYRIVRKGKIPNICLSEGLEFPGIPECLQDLTCLEERLILPRIPFMRFISLGYERQCAIRGAVANIPISVVETVIMLPRRFDNSHIIQVHLKRRLEYEQNFMTETVRPAKILEALNYLLGTELYVKHNIQMSSDWLANTGNEETVPFIADPADEAEVRDLINAR
ncbi:uncharacterized protein Pka-C1 isoform X1 [Bactrocera oleae]|uniref:uncharacterized protein Pka-C1 isoform X1 n=1 Tax=Bactrocera oleae TaxID=104688 RepID=UPI00387EC03A